ncbi:hypothetical protein [Pseudoalteromonas sp. R3]|uniref:hypothetical protein n=1 Tax=Pseudoalteromonas sp. R3 TaxID=1709477 RepID=UPI0006B4403E|nr:hypothetical protein [Pseudoalteromonas sp. R3]AZZ98325.1 hypothetical protein ELR70_15105 [Pseudoalteromonas sp. R3]
MEYLWSCFKRFAVKMKLTTLVSFALWSAQSYSQREISIEASLTIEPTYLEESLVKGREVVNQMVKSGIFSPEPQERFDYLNFHFPEKETRVLGYQLVYFNYEYADKYIGCCINPGAAVVLRLPSNEDDAYLQKFAKRNYCNISRGNHIYMPREIQKMIVKLGIPTVNLVELSCKERDRHELEEEIMAHEVR